MFLIIFNTNAKDYQLILPINTVACIPKSDPFKKGNFKYNKENDVYICPNNKNLNFNKISRTSLDSSFVVTNRIYQCNSCKNVN